MPLVKIHTNQTLDSTAAEEVAEAATTIVAKALGKPESVTMAVVETGMVLRFGGNFEPAALFEVEGLGSTADPMQQLTENLSALAESKLGVSGSRTFVKLLSIPRGFWGQDQKVF